MGVEIGAVVLNDDSIKLSGAVERPGHPQIGKDYGMCIGKGACGINVTDTMDGAGVEQAVIIDFLPNRPANSLNWPGDQSASGDRHHRSVRNGPRDA